MINALHLAVEPVSHIFQQEERVGGAARVLPLLGEHFEDLVVVGHAEVATEQQVLGAPVVAAHEGVQVFHAALAGSGVAQMTHIDLSGIGQPALGKVRVLTCAVVAVVEHTAVSLAEHLGDGILAQGTFAEDVLFARLRTHLQAGYSCALLTAVLLLLHHQIELAHRVHPRPVLLLIPAERLQ